jgi:hypothetical protein
MDGLAQTAKSLAKGGRAGTSPLTIEGSGSGLNEQLVQLVEAEVQIIMIHERRPDHGAEEFERFLAQCPRELGQRLFQELAIPLYSDELHTRVTSAMVAKKLGAHHVSRRLGLMTLTQRSASRESSIRQSVSSVLKSRTRSVPRSMSRRDGRELTKSRTQELWAATKRLSWAWSKRSSDCSTKKASPATMAHVLSGDADAELDVPCPKFQVVDSKSLASDSEIAEVRSDRSSFEMASRSRVQASTAARRASQPQL